MTDCLECYALSSTRIYATRAHRTCPACNGTPARKLQRDYVQSAGGRAKIDATSTARSKRFSKWAARSAG